MKQDRFTTRQGRLLIAAVAVCAGASAGAIWWYYARQSEAMESAVVDELTAVADFKTKQIANWRKERIGDGDVIAASPLMRVAQRVLSRRAADEQDRTAILQVLDALTRAFSYTNAALVDLDGKVLVQLNPRDIDTAEQMSLARAAMKSGEVELSDLYRDPRSGQAVMAVTIPVAHAGAFILAIEASSFLYPYLESWPTASTTAETFLFRREGDEIVYLSNARREPGTDSIFSRAAARTLFPDGKAPAPGQLRKGADFRGVSALVVIRSIPESPWYLDTQLDVGEVESPMRRLWWEMVLMFALIGLASGVVVGLVWRDQQLKERIRTSAEIQALNASLINAQEEERGRIARELHDDISQQIAAASIAMSNLKIEISGSPAAALDQTGRVQQTLADLAEGIRRLSHELHPAVLEHAGLGPALWAYCSEFSELTGVRVAVETHGSFDDMPRATALCIYRIVQEGLGNVAKHAKVTDASLQLRRSEDVVGLTIADRGAGIALVRAAAATGLGLLSIKERTRLVNGTVEIQSAPNRGTTISVKIPARNWNRS